MWHVVSVWDVSHSQSESQMLDVPYVLYILGHEVSTVGVLADDITLQFCDFQGGASQHLRRSD